MDPPPEQVGPSEAGPSQPPEPGPLLASTLDSATANFQMQSPLFSEIPAEIRTLILRFAMQPAHNPEKAYKEGSYYYRPTHTSSPLAATSLLLTCRRIYLEAALLLAESTPLTYWWNRPPPTKPNSGNPIPDLERLNPDQRSVATVQIFVQQYQLEGGLRDVFKDAKFTPAHLVLTFRHGDWWHWEWDAPLALDPGKDAQANPVSEFNEWRAARTEWEGGSWGLALREIKGLKSLTLELETVAPKKAQLEAIVRRFEGLTWEMGDGARMVFEPREKREWEWSGENRYLEFERKENAQRYPFPRRARPAYRLRGRRVYIGEGVVQGETGVRNGVTENGEGTAEAPRLEYYVVELVWKRKEGRKG